MARSRDAAATADVLDPVTAARLAEAPLTYAEVGATLAPTLPAGYHHLDVTGPLGTGDQVFTDAADRLLRWGVQLGAGLRVEASAPLVAPGVVALVKVGAGPARLPAPVRVVSVVDEPGRRGFVYGTLPHHPETGEELFVVEQAYDGSVVLRVRAFSRPATLLSRAAGPLGRVGQRVITRGYLRALR